MVSLRRGRGPRHARKAIFGTEEARPGPPDWSPVGDAGKAPPEPSSELRSGVGLVHSTDEAVEGDETRGGNPRVEARVRTQSRTALPPNLARVNAAAQQAAQTRFTALLHHVDIAALERAVRRQKGLARAGGDGMPVAA